MNFNADDEYFYDWDDNEYVPQYYVAPRSEEDIFFQDVLLPAARYYTKSPF